MQLTEQNIANMAQRRETTDERSSPFNLLREDNAQSDNGESSNKTSPMATEDEFMAKLSQSPELGLLSDPKAGGSGSGPTAMAQASAPASCIKVEGLLSAEKKRSFEDRVDSGCELDDAVDQKTGKKTSPSPFRSPPKRFPVKRFEHRPPPFEDNIFTRDDRNLQPVIPRIIPQAGEVPDEFEYKIQGRTVDWATYEQQLREDALERYIIETDPSQIKLLKDAMEAGIERRDMGDGCYPCAYDCELFASRPCKHLEIIWRENPHLAPQAYQTTAATRSVAMPHTEALPLSKVMEAYKEASDDQQTLISQAILSIQAGQVRRPPQ